MSRLTTESATAGIKNTNSVEVYSVAEIVAEPLHAEVCELLSASPESTVGFEPSVMVAARETIWRSKKRPKLYLVRDDEGQLIGVFPLITSRIAFIRHHRIWCHEFPFATTPILRSGCAEEAFLALVNSDLNALRNSNGIYIPNVQLDGWVADAIESAVSISGGKMRAMNCYSRPILRVPSDYVEFERQTLSGGRRRRLARLRRNLETLGAVRFAEHSTPADCMIWLEKFIGLENSGWKAAAATAIGANPVCVSFHRSTAAALAGADRYRIYVLSLDDEPIAIAIGMICLDGRIYLCKTTYDENFRQYSPGIQLMLALSRHMSDTKSANWVDSCADAETSFIADYWPARLQFGDILIQPGGVEWRLRLLACVLTSSQALYRWVAPKARIVLRKVINPIIRGVNNELSTS